MYAINLVDYVNVLKNMDQQAVNLWLKQYGFHHALDKGMEQQDLICLINLFKGKEYTFFDGFYPGFSIPRIGKEFDLLRIGKESIVNIELKHKSTEEKIRQQLLKNRYYLKFFKKKIYMFTFIAESGKFYTLDETFHEVSFMELLTRLEEQKDLYTGSITRLFDVNAFLISPYRHAEEFINNQYFLTTQQNSIEKEIRELLAHTERSEVVLIKGEAGTGKSLLLYDLAKSIDRAIIMRGTGITKGHRTLLDAGFRIIGSEDYEQLNDTDCSVLLLDEGQSVDKETFEKILGITKDKKISMIIGYDPYQVSLKNSEILTLFEKNRTQEEYVLSGNIRISENIISFIRNMFDLKNKPKRRVRFSSIKIQYYSDLKELREYRDHLEKEGWKIMDFSGMKEEEYVPDEEYAKAAVIVSDQFIYHGSRLSCADESSDQVVALYQAMTRVRDEMILVVVNNKKLFRKCVSIVNAAEQ